MKLDEIEKMIEAATPAPWPAEFGRCDFPDEGSMACGPIITLDEDEECRQAQADQDFICMARLVMPKLLKVAMRAKDVRIFALTLPDDADRGDADELLDQALAELGQP